MKKIMLGILMLILFGLGNLVAQIQTNPEGAAVNIYQAKNAAGINRYFVQDADELRCCKVSDTTGTPLNIRDLPNGKVIGKLKNGTIVYTDTDMNNTNYRNRSEIKLTRRGKAKGWVASEFLDCE